jgi:O-antigen ligase
MIIFESASRKVLGLYIITLPILNYTVELNYISQFLFIVAILFTLINLIKSKNILLNFLLIPLSLFLLMNFLGYFYSFIKPQSFGFLITLIQLYLLFFVVFYNYSDKNVYTHFSKIMLRLGLVLVLYSLLLFGINFVEIIRNQESFGNEVNQINSFGFYMVIAFMGSLGIYLHNKNKIYILYSILFIFFGIITGSRKALFLFIFILIMGIVFLTKNRLKTFALFTVLLSIIYFGLNLFNLVPSIARTASLIDAILADGNIDGSTQTRLQMIDFGFKIFLERPIFGFGPDQYRFLYKNSFGISRPSHNNYIELLVNYGLIGFISYYFFLIVIIKKFLGIKTIKGSFVIILIIILFFNDLTTVSIAFKFNWILLGFLYSFYLNNLKRRRLE